MLFFFYMFETSLKMQVFDNKVREHAATKYLHESSPDFYQSKLLSAKIIRP